MKNEKWNVGKLKSTVVSETKIKNNNFPANPNLRYSSDDEIEYYGGYLVCESIGNIEYASLISSAPDLLRCLKDAIEDVELERNKAPKEWYDAVSKAEGINNKLK